MTNLPKTSAPAERAFAAAGIHCLEDLAKWKEKDLLSLHGVGPKALRILAPYLEKAGITLQK